MTRWLRLAGIAVALASAPLACNSIAGIHQPELVGDDASADDGGGTDVTVTGDGPHADGPVGDAPADGPGEGGAGCDGGCAAGQRCVAGQCACDSTSCTTGCCEGTTCVALGATTCGAKGAACKACDPNLADTCNASGTCVCGAGSAACQTGQQCVQGQCQCTTASCPSGCCQGAPPSQCVTPSKAACGVQGSSCTACDANLSDGCDAQTGKCTCGTNGQCAAGEQCQGGACTCSGTTCTGCCQNGSCVGSSLATCGTGGAACVTCSTTLADTCGASGCQCGTGPQCAQGQHCSAGQCACDPTSCTTGCCNGTTCTSPNLAECGANGVGCSPCNATIADRCTAAGTCSCGGGQACVTGQQCVGGACTCNATSCPSGCCSGGTCSSPSPTTCGTQGGACSNCQSVVLNASGATCTSAGACDYSNCSAGFADVDGNRANGCESTTPKGVTESGNLVLWLAGENWNGSSWLDASGAGRNATTYSASVGSATQNGRTVAVFNGGELLVNNGFPSWSAGLTVMTVANTTTDDFLVTFGVSYNPSCTTTAPLGAPGCVAYDMLGFGAGMGLQQCDPGIGGCYQAYPFGVAGNGWVRTTAESTPGQNPSFHTYENGSDEGAIDHNLAYPYPAPWATPRTDTIIGWRNYRGSVAELIVFNVPLSTASRQALDAYLANKWNVH